MDAQQFFCLCISIAGVMSMSCHSWLSCVITDLQITGKEEQNGDAVSWWDLMPLQRFGWLCHSLIVWVTNSINHRYQWISHLKKRRTLVFCWDMFFLFLWPQLRTKGISSCLVNHNWKFSVKILACGISLWTQNGKCPACICKCVCV